MNDLTAIKILGNFMKRVTVTGVEEAQALVEITKWLGEKEKQVLSAMNNGQVQASDVVPEPSKK